MVKERKKEREIYDGDRVGMKEGRTEKREKRERKSLVST